MSNIKTTARVGNVRKKINMGVIMPLNILLTDDSAAHILANKKENRNAKTVRKTVLANASQNSPLAKHFPKLAIVSEKDGIT
jgi:hypothetical protein